MSISLRLMRAFSIRTRMLGAIGMVLVLFALVGATGLLGGRHLVELNADFNQHAVNELRDMGLAQQRLGELRRHEKDMVIHYEDGVAVLRSREAWTTALAGLRTAFDGMLERDKEGANALARMSIQEIEAYAKATGQVLAQMQNGAYDTALAADKMLLRAKQHIEKVEANLVAIAQSVDQKIQASQQAFNSSMQRMLLLFVGVLALVLVLVVPLTLLNSHSIIAPVRQARDLALAIADGDLSQTVDGTGQDEAAELQRALVKMQAALAAMVSDVRRASASILGASSEVASGNLDLSSRTEQAASNLQQTAASMQQLTHSVQQSAEASRQASTLAGSASSVAERGGAVVAQVVSTMDEINQSSKRIADIIGTIDSIAFQTNILALNAAVEAARAGEQGRGFAVVASEVRSLAQRSAEAAREIKTLIGSSVDKVETGARLVQDAGSTMGDIVSSVRRVRNIIEEITGAAAEQSDGIGQINSAVGALDAMTQQNAALVEQGAAAAESLKDQAERLTGTVARFRLQGHGQAIA